MLLVPSRRLYDRLYRRGAPWEGGPREELVGLVKARVLTPSSPGPRALDVGCGSGANALFLAENGFEVTGVDFSTVALAKAMAAAAERELNVDWLECDLLGDVELTGRYDLVLDYGTLDDFRAADRALLASRIAAWTRPGGRFLLWCFYRDIAWWRRRGARFPGGLRHGEVERLFSPSFGIERLPRPLPKSGFACFLMTRR
jgi:SAM-dependent methyltransferase